MVLISKVKKRRINAGENEGQADGSDKDNVNESNSESICITLTQPDILHFVNRVHHWGN